MGSLSKTKLIMPTTMITTDDLREFKLELLEEIQQLLSQQSSGKLKKFFKSSEVMDMLQISPGTLQNLRVNGTLPYIKVGGLIYYDSEEINRVMMENRVHNKF